MLLRFTSSQVRFVAVLDDLLLAARMTAGTGKVGKIAGILTIRAAILFVFRCRTVTGWMSTFFSLSHGIPPVEIEAFS